jgi:hypothetical protein
MRSIVRRRVPPEANQNLDVSEFSNMRFRSFRGGKNLESGHLGYDTVQYIATIVSDETADSIFKAEVSKYCIFVNNTSLDVH